MKHRTWKRIAALALTGALLLSGCSGGEAQFEEKSYTPDAQVSAVTIDVQDRDVAVELSADGQVHIQYFESSKEFYDISVSGGVLTMNSASDKVHFCTSRNRTLHSGRGSSRNDPATNNTSTRTAKT